MSMCGFVKNLHSIQQGPIQMLPTQQLLVRRSVLGVVKSLLHYIDKEDKLISRMFDSRQGK
jgi:hypothetical protein